jgi:hypothetical protein
VASVAAYGESGGNINRAFWCVGTDSNGGAVGLLDEAGGLPPHAEGKAAEVGGFACQEVEEVPLGHERDEFRVGWEVGEVGHDDGPVADEAGHPGDFGVGKLEEFFEETKFVEKL